MTGPWLKSCVLPLAGSTVAPDDKVSTGESALTSAPPRTANVTTLSVEKTTCIESVAWKKKSSGLETCRVTTSISASQPSGSSPKQDVHNVVITRLMATTTAKLIL